MKMTHEEYVGSIHERCCHCDTMVIPGPMEMDLCKTIESHEFDLIKQGKYEAAREFMNLPIEPLPVGY